MLTDPETRKGQPEHYICSPSKNENESTSQLILTLIRKKGKTLSYSGAGMGT
jgi:hypothetical protein